VQPETLILFTFFGCLVGFTAIFLGVAALLQPLLYSTAADKLPLRAVVAGLLLTIVVTGWAYLNTRASHKDKYGTLFEYSATAVTDVEEFQAVRRLSIKGDDGQLKETTVMFRWKPGAGPNSGDFLEAETQKPFSRSTSIYITPALNLKPDTSGEWKKFVTPTDGTKYVGLEKSSDPITYTEEGGTRFVSDENLRKLQSPSTSGAIAVLLLNLGHFVAWFVALWPIMRYRLGHALIMVCLFGGVTMLILMPLLFNTNSIKPKLIRQDVTNTATK
jgi:hypothetical protein